MKKIVAVFFVFSLLVRFWNFPAWFGFDYDQEINAWLAKMILIDHKPTLIGPETSVGAMYVGPYFNYIIALFFLLGQMNPMWTILLNISISGLTLFAIYQIGRIIYSKQVGLIAMIIYGFSGFAINYDRVLWNPTPIPLISLLALFFLHNYLITARQIYLFIAMVCLGFILHLHFQVVFLGAYFFLALIVTKPKTFLNPKSYLSMALPLVFFLLPLVIFDLRHNFINSSHFLQFFFAPTHTGSLDIIYSVKKIFDVTISLMSNFWGITNDYLTKIIFVILTIATLKNSQRNYFDKILISLLVFSLVMFIFYSGPLPIQYFLFLTPVLVFIPANLLTRLNRNIFLIPILLIYSFLNLPSVMIAASDLSLKNKQEAVTYISHQAKDKANFQVDIITAPGLNTGYKYLFWQSGANPHYGSDRKDLESFKIVVPKSLSKPENLNTSFGGIGVEFNDHE